MLKNIGSVSFLDTARFSSATKVTGVFLNTV